MKENVRKWILVTGILVLGMLIISKSNVQAALQANMSTHISTDYTKTKKTLNEWMQAFREMERPGQSMGLRETEENINADLSPKNGYSNNIDVHLIKSTEYGAMAILSISGFGNPNKLQESTIKSTTGNVTGVYLTGDRAEWTAGLFSDSATEKNKRYYDLYTINDQSSAKIGDALGLDTYKENPGCSTKTGDDILSWHSDEKIYWVDNTSYGIIRGFLGIFRFGVWQNASGIDKVPDLRSKIYRSWSSSGGRRIIGNKMITRNGKTEKWKGGTNESKKNCNKKEAIQKRISA